MFTLTIETDNAAFDVDQGNELAAILRKLADVLDHTSHESGDSGSVRDYNGNTVGHWTLDPREYREDN